jgi:transposase
VSLERLSAEQLAALVAEQAAVIEQLRGEIVELRCEVADLKRRLAQNSRNSSRPPSSDGLSKPPPKSLRRPSGLKPGGQPGHEGGHLAQVAVPDEVLDHLPGLCAGCGCDLHDAAVMGYEARQVFDLPEIRLRVVEHRGHQRRCGCGRISTAEFPAATSAPAQYGPRIRALGIYLIARQHLPYHRAAELLYDWFSTGVSTGTLATFIAQGAADLEPFRDEVHRQICSSEVVHFDETGARVAGRTRWLHAASTSRATCFAIHDSRGVQGINHAGVLPNFTGVAIHDGYHCYRTYPQATHALCNAHHLRDLLGVIEADEHQNQTWARQMDGLLRTLSTTVQKAKRDGHSSLDPLQLAGYHAAYQQIITLGHRQNPPPTIRTGKRGPIRKTHAANLLHRLDRDRHHLLRFAADFRIPFDNNLVERDIRMVKLQQKISGCWRTNKGADRFLAIRSYISTATKHGHHVTRALTQLAAREPWTLPAT